MKFMHSANAGYSSVVFYDATVHIVHPSWGSFSTTIIDDRLADSFHISEENPGCKSNRQKKSMTATAHLSCIEINASSGIVKKKLKKLCGFSHQPFQGDIICRTLPPESHNTNPVMSV